MGQPQRTSRHQDPSVGRGATTEGREVPAGTICGEGGGGMTTQGREASRSICGEGAQPLRAGRLRIHLWGGGHQGPQGGVQKRKVFFFLPVIYIWNYPNICH